MTVYVDDHYAPYRGMRMCHLQADTEEELHAFAARLGLKREWFQPGTRPEAAHYDVSESKRLLALQLGAQFETMRQGAARRTRMREARLKEIA